METITDGHKGEHSSVARAAKIITNGHKGEHSGVARAAPPSFGSSCNRCSSGMAEETKKRKIVLLNLNA